MAYRKGKANLFPAMIFGLASLGTVIASGVAFRIAYENHRFNEIMALEAAKQRSKERREFAKKNISLAASAQ